MTRVHYCCRALLLLLVVSLFSTLAIAQTELLRLGGSDPAILQVLAERHENLYRQTIASLPSENRKDFQQLYKKRWENAKEKFEKKEIYTSKHASDYLDQLVTEIKSNNPQLSSIPLNCYFSRSGNPNASYIGEGIILINMGLFTKLQNESQVAFVICHEIAHQYLQHSENTIRKYVNRLNSKEVQAELKKIRESQYGRSQPLEKLSNSITFDTRRHVRQNESAADSMAIELMKNTRFDPSEAISTLRILDNIDSDTISTNELLKKIFNSERYPFQQKWIAREEGLLGGHAIIETSEFEDSLKTHPDCKLRIADLEPVLDKLKAEGNKNAVNADMFNHFVKLFRYEVVEYAYSSGNYARSLYYTLDMLQRMPTDPYLVSNVGRVLNGMYFAQKDHHLSSYVDLPAPAFPPPYNQLLQFIQNLYLENLASINYHFLDRYHNKLNDYPPFREAYSTSIQIAQK